MDESVKNIPVSCGKRKKVGTETTRAVMVEQYKGKLGDKGGRYAGSTIIRARGKRRFLSFHLKHSEVSGRKSRQAIPLNGGGSGGGAHSIFKGGLKTTTRER